MLQLIRRGRAKVRDLRDWGYKREQASGDNSREEVERPGEEENRMRIMGVTRRGWGDGEERVRRG